MKYVSPDKEWEVCLIGSKLFLRFLKPGKYDKSHVGYVLKEQSSKSFMWLYVRHFGRWPDKNQANSTERLRFEGVIKRLLTV